MNLDSWYRGRAGIYKLSIANHVYIGSSVSLFSRLKQHRTDLKCNRHQNQFLQRAVNKYGFENLKYEVLILFSNIKLTTLRRFEKEYIKHFAADLNLKLDPVSENNCIATSKTVYQYDRTGKFIKEWNSCNEAARYYKVDSSGINVACTHPERQHMCAGFLWSYKKPYPHNKYISLIYCFDLKGQLLGTHSSTKEIAEIYFSDTDRKTVLSQLRKKIDSGKPYKNIYLSSSIEFSIDTSYKPRYKERTELEQSLSGNPIIYVFGKTNQLLYQKHLLDFDNPVYIRHKIRTKCNKYRLSKDGKYYIVKRFRIESKELNTGQIQVFNSASHAAEVLFQDRKLNTNILKHLHRGTQYKGYYFKRVLYKTP